MKSYKWIVFALLVSSLTVFSQEKYTRHTVAKGETVSEIAKKYNVTTAVIYELNPDAVNGIKQKTLLLIPTSKTKTIKSKKVEVSKELLLQNHEVLPKETVYGIAKQANISVSELYALNPDLEKEGLKIGQSIKIPQIAADHLTPISSAPKVAENVRPQQSEKNISIDKAVNNSKKDDQPEVQNNDLTHEVLNRESWYSIARKYGVTVSALQKANQSLEKSSLKTGQKISVPSKSSALSDQITVTFGEDKGLKSEKKSAKIETPVQVDIASKSVSSVENANTENTTTRVVLPKESLYSIAKKYGLTIEEIKKANPKLGNKSLKAGQSISLPVKEKINSSVVEENASKKKPEHETLSSKVVVEKTKETTENKTEDKAENIIIHEVLPKETKYGIAKKYGLSVAELEKQNPSVVKKLLVGSVLKISTSVVVEKAIEIEQAVALESSVVKEKLENKEVESMIHNEAFVDELISRASENIGTRYRSGGTSTEGFDCSGLMYYTFSTTDVKLPRSSAEMADFGSKIEIQNAQKGDLIFFSTRRSKRINHVGMVVEVLDGEIKFIHSATHGGVIISSTKESYYERNLVQVNRVL
jgi:cell wall-associated NlpC family hydrolase